LQTPAADVPIGPGLPSRRSIKLNRETAGQYMYIKPVLLFLPFNAHESNEADSR